MSLDLLRDVHDYLVRVGEFLDRYTDASEDDGPNDAMSLFGELEGNYGGPGLLERVEKAIRSAPEGSNNG